MRGADATLAATRFLVDAVVSAPHPTGVRWSTEPAFPWWDFKAQALWLLELFERMERRERPAARSTAMQELAGP